MDVYETLRRMAKKHYREEVKAAGERLKLAVKNINMLHTLMGSGPKQVRTQKFRRSPPGTPFANLRTLEAAEAVLIESGPLTIAAITIEVQRRGHRAADDPRAVAHTIKCTFAYHKDRFVRDANYHWIVI